MKKQDKINFINKVNIFFVDAKNHGNNGDNWWYPTQNTIAYNVKLHCQSKDISDIRKLLTKRQNEYYSDHTLYEILQEQQNDQARQFSDELDEMYNVKSGYAGRSGGWLEVKYSNELTDEMNNNDEIDYYYKKAKELQKKEQDVRSFIEKSLAQYKKYINSDEYCRDVANILTDDETIGEIYKDRAKNLLDKLN